MQFSSDIKHDVTEENSADSEAYSDYIFRVSEEEINKKFWEELITYIP
jgi:hypothetical protein